MSRVKAFFKRKNIEVSLKRYGIDALGAMAQGLFCTLLVGTILDTLGTQLGIGFLAKPLIEIGGTGYTIGKFASAMVGPGMAVAIGFALNAPAMVLFSLIPVGYATNVMGGAGGPLAVYVVAIVAAEFGKMVSKETKIDILVTPIVTILVGVGLAYFVAAPIGKGAMAVGTLIKWATTQQPFVMGIVVSVIVGIALTLPISSAAICAALSLTGSRAERRSPAAALTWSASRSSPSVKTAGAASFPRVWAPPCSRWAISSATRRYGSPPSRPAPSPAPWPPACSSLR